MAVKPVECVGMMVDGVPIARSVDE